MSRKRNNPPPNSTEKIASLLLTLKRPNARGELEPIIPWEHARKMSAAQICSLFQFDHAVYDTWGGSNHPTNLTALLISEHREKTRKDQGIIAKARNAAKPPAAPKHKMKSRGFQKPQPGAKFDWKRRKYVFQQPNSSE